MKNKLNRVYDDSIIEVTKISHKIRALRISRGYLTVESFTKAHGLSKSPYKRFEDGEDINFSSLVKIIKAFDMSFSEFFSE